MADATIDRIAIDVEYQANSSATGIKNLKKEVSELSQVIPTASTLLSRFSSRLSKLQGSNSFTALGEAKSKINDLVSNLPSASEKLTSFNSSINKTQKRISDINSLDTSSFVGQMSMLVTGISSINSIGDSNGLTKILNQLKKIPDINQKLDSKTITEFSAKVQMLSSNLQPLATNLDTVSKSLSNMPSKLNKVSTYTAKASNNFSLLNKVSSLISFGTFAVLGKKIGSTLSNVTQSSNEYVEALNLFNVSMGESSETATEWINTISEAIGLDPADMMKNMGTFNIMAKGFGIASDKAYTMSKNLTQLVYDFSSFYNIDFDESANKVRSALAGELEPVEVEPIKDNIISFISIQHIAA